MCKWGLRLHSAHELTCNVSYKFQRVEKISGQRKDMREFSWRMMQVELMSAALSGIWVMLPLNLEVYIYVKVKLCVQHVTQCTLYDILHISSCTH